MKRLVIIGAGGHGKVCADAARLCGYDDVLFLDDGKGAGLPVSGTVSDFPEYSGSDFFVAVGNGTARESIMRRLSDHGEKVITLVHPKSVVAKSAVIGAGTFVAAGAVINPDAVIGVGVIINTCASADHDCRVGDFSHVSVGAHLAGTVILGENTFIGAGATVVNNITVCGSTVVGAGALVLHDINEAGTYVGVPCRRIK